MILSRSVTRAIIIAVFLFPGWLIAGSQTASPSKLPLRAALVLSPDFCATKDRWNTFEIGKDACAQLELALNGVFSQLTRVGSVPSSGEEQIVLVPRFGSLDRTNCSWTYSNRELVVLLEWTIKDMSGKTILLLAAQGSAKHQIGTAFSYKKNRKLLASDAVADAIANSVAKIAAALEQRSLNSGSAAEQALLNQNSPGGTSSNGNTGPGSGGFREVKVDPLQAGLFLTAARSGDAETVCGWLAANPQMIDVRDVSGKRHCSSPPKADKCLWCAHLLNEARM